MLETLTGLPDGVIGFEAVGEVHAGDYEQTLVPAIEAAAAGGGVRLVYVLGERFDGYSGGAAWQDTKLGFEHLKAWERTALVTDVDWVVHLTSLFGWMFPGECRHFPLGEKAEAIEWAAGVA